jgi:hypothetical protein
MRAALRHLPGLLPLLLTACLAPRAATMAPQRVVQEPEPALEPVAEPAPDEAGPTWSASAGTLVEAALADLVLPPDCSVDRAEGAVRVRCADDLTLVELRDRSEADLDGLQSETLELFVRRGALAATLASPGCRVDGQHAECAYVAARSDEGVVGTAWLAVGDTGPRAWTLRCVYFTSDPYFEQADPVCRQLLEQV